MKRWTVGLLLLLVPFTMAPRTSLNPDGSVLELSGVLSRTEIRPGGAVTFVVQARNGTAEVVPGARLVITVEYTGDPAALTLLASPRCSVTPEEKHWLVECSLDTLRPGQSKTVRVTAHVGAPGTLTFSPGGTASVLMPVPDGTPQVVEVGP